MDNDKLQLACRKIKEAKRVLLVAHYAPDGDTLSSVCAFQDILKTLKKDYTAFCLDKPTPDFSFLPHIHKIISDKKSLAMDSYDLVITLDCSNLSRTGLAAELSRRPKHQYVIEIDHHPKLDEYSDLELRYPWSSSTAELVYYFIKANKIKFNKNLANCVLTGILTDTGNFLYPSTSEKTVKIASEMLVYGARFPRIIENTWRNKSLSAMKIWGKALNNLKISPRYRIGYTVLTRDEIASSGATEEDLEGISGFLSNLEGIRALLVLREESDGRLKGSLRTTKPDVDVSLLAGFLGGGGHSKAAGFVVDSLELNKLLEPESEYRDNNV